jgi:putative spermidine/putrescine transport system permease protein
MDLKKLALTLVVGIILLFLLAPILVIFLVSFNGTELLTFPPPSYSLRWFAQYFRNEEFIRSTLLSLLIAVESTVLVLFLGILASLSITRYSFRGKRMVEIFLLSPLFIPRILLGVGLLILFVKLNLLGTLTGMVTAHVLILVPYATRSLLVGFYGIDPSIEEAARCLGAHPVKAFFKVTLPLLKSGLLAAALFSFITSFADILLALFLSGPKTVTLPLRMFNYLEWNHDPFIAAMAVLQIVFILIMSLLLDRIVRLEKLI